MAGCRFMHDNFITDAGMITPSSARPGLVGTPAPQVQGSATCYAAGEHSGDQDQMLVVEIDSVAAGASVGQATFRWKRASSQEWQASGVATSGNLIPLADGVWVKWLDGAGQSFYKGDRWSVLAVRRQGAAMLLDHDRDTAWRSMGCQGEALGVDLGQTREVKALVLADHNLGQDATALLKASGNQALDSSPLWNFDPAGGELVDSDGNPGTNARTTPRTYIDGGALKYAAAGESCFKDGRLSIAPAVANLLSHTESLDDSAWSKTRASIDSDAIAGPDGGINADKLVEDGTASTDHYLYRPVPGLGDNIDYTWAVFAKAGERHWLYLSIRDKAGSLHKAFFNLSNGSIGATIALRHGMQGIGNGWHRCWVSADIASGGTPQIQAIIADGDNSFVHDGDGSSGLYLWGAQLTEGATPLPYAPNDASSPNDMGGASAADAISFPLSQEMKNILSVFEGAAVASGTLVAEWMPGLSESEMAASTWLPIVNVTAANGGLLPLYKGGTGEPYINSNDGTTSAVKGLAFAAGTPYGLAVRWSSATGEKQAGVDHAWGAAAGFDGAFALGDSLHLGYEPYYPFHLGRVKIWGAWLNEAPLEIMDPWDWPDYSQAVGITSPHLVRFLDQSHRHWRLELADPDNAEGIIRAGGLYLGGYFQPGRNFSLGCTSTTTASRQTASGAAGKLAGCSLGLSQSRLINFSRLGQEDVQGFQDMMAAANGHDNGMLRPLFFTPCSDQPGDTLCCLPQPELSMQQTAAGRWDLSLSLREAVKTDV